MDQMDREGNKSLSASAASLKYSMASLSLYFYVILGKVTETRCMHGSNLREITIHT